MSDKTEYLEFWGYKPGTPEAEIAWEQKVAMMQGRRFIDLPMMAIVQPDICYDSPIDGRPITNKYARLEDLARNNCREYDPGQRQDYDRRVSQAEEDLEKAFERSIDMEIAKMPARKREKLQAELEGGATVEPIRQTAPLATAVNLEN